MVQNLSCKKLRAFIREHCVVLKGPHFTFSTLLVIRTINKLEVNLKLKYQIIYTLSANPEALLSQPLARQPLHGARLAGVFLCC